MTDALALSDQEVHVWLASLEVPAADLDRFERTLDAAERARAARYRFRRDRDHFVARRGLLRQILARYLDADPWALRFATGPHGKPRLEAEGREGLTFNLSDSHGLAAYAVTRGRAVGIDVERIDRAAAREEVAERFFSPREVEVLRALPEDQRAEAFFACWTRKEAYIKARGEGLTIPLDKLAVSLAPGEPLALLWTAWDGRDSRRWCLSDLSLLPDHACAICIEGDVHLMPLAYPVHHAPYAACPVVIRRHVIQSANLPTFPLDPRE